MGRKSLNVDSMKTLEDLAVSLAKNTCHGRANGQMFYSSIKTAEDHMVLLEENKDYFRGIFLDSCRDQEGNPRLDLPDYHFVLFRDRGKDEKWVAEIHYLLGAGKREVY